MDLENMEEVQYRLMRVVKLCIFVVAIFGYRDPLFQKLQVTGWIQ